MQSIAYILRSIIGFFHISTKKYINIKYYADNLNANNHRRVGRCKNFCNLHIILFKYKKNR